MLSIMQAYAREHQRYEVLSMERKLEYIGNTLDMFDIQKY